MCAIMRWLRISHYIGHNIIRWLILYCDKIDGHCYYVNCVHYIRSAVCLRCNLFGYFKWWSMGQAMLHASLLCLSFTKCHLASIMVANTRTFWFEHKKKPFHTLPFARLLRCAFCYFSHELFPIAFETGQIKWEAVTRFIFEQHMRMSATIDSGNFNHQTQKPMSFQQIRNMPSHSPLTSHPEIDRCVLNWYMRQIYISAETASKTLGYTHIRIWMPALEHGGASNTVWEFIYLQIDQNSHSSHFWFEMHFSRFDWKCVQSKLSDRITLSS